MKTASGAQTLGFKIASTIVVTLSISVALNFWLTQRRANRQAEKAFSDRLRTMTDVALGSRIATGEGGHAWEIAQRYAKTQGFSFRTPARSPMNPADTFTDFDQRAMAALQAHPETQQYVETGTENGRNVLFFARAVVVTQDCQACHGAWEITTDETRQNLPALFSITAPTEELAQNEKSNAGLFLLISICSLFFTSVVVLLCQRRVVILPLKRVKALLQEVADGDLSKRLEATSQDEVGQMVHALNATVEKISVALGAFHEKSLSLADASEEFAAVSQQISANSEETSAQVATVSAATEEVNRNLQTVATASEEMSATVQEIAKNASEAAKIAAEAMKTAAETNAVVGKLGDSSAEIGQVIKVITSIAQKTDLLALNATVEAARAGEAGAGFAVVANEVKELAKQTATATEDISKKIEAIQVDTKSAVQAIESISGIIDKVNSISSTIATAVEEQSATTAEMSRNLSEAAKGSGEVAQNIHGVAQAAQNTSHGATDSLKAAKSLAEMSTQLRELVDQFKLDNQASSNGARFCRSGAEREPSPAQGAREGILVH